MFLRCGDYSAKSSHEQKAPDDRAKSLHAAYAARVGRIRSEVIRSAIEHYLEESLEDDIDRALVEGYKKKPQKPDPYLDAVARESIAAEPW